MAEGNKKWIIRDASGRISGPFTTEKVLYKIGRSEFSGDEAISLYPGGKWISITQDPQFYDKLLEVLAANPTAGIDDTTRILEFTKPQYQTQLQQTSSGEDTAPGTNAENSLGPNDEIRVEDVLASTSTSTKSTSRGAREEAGSSKPKRKKKRRRPSAGRHQDIELVDTRPAMIKAMLLRARIPFLILAIVGVIVIFLGGEVSNDEERIHLLAPQKGQTQTSAESLKDRKRNGAGAFVKDTFSGYVRAQNDFVYVIEKNNKDAEAMALLCMTYLQLWPYAFQDSKDARTIATMVQMSSSVDPAGVHSATCRTVDLIVRARFQEAMSLVDAILDTRVSNSPPIIFYFLKGLLYSGGVELSAAIGYLQSSQQLWPQWILPYFVEAQVQAKLEKNSDAANLYRRILKANPEHAAARIELGILEYKVFGHADQGEQLLHQGLDQGVATRALMSRGNFGLAEIYLKRGDQARALKFAQKSFSMNSAYAPAKNLIVQLGGVGVLKGTKVKGQQLVFEGDQFAREGDCQTAQAHYKAAFEEDGRNATAAMKAARCLWKMSLSTEAIEWLDRSIKADPSLIEAYVQMAEYQADRYNFQAAGRILDRARAVNPKSYEVFRGYASVELKRGNAAGALAYGKQAAQLYENDVEAQILLAEASLALKDYKMAYNYASKAVEIDVNYRKAQIVFAQALAGLQGVDVGIDYMMKLVGNYSQVSEYRLALGRMLMSDERYRQAEEIFRQIIKLEEKPKDAYIELAKAVWGEANNPEALNLLLKAAVLDPADAEPLYISGGIYLDMRKPIEAKVQFKRVLSINKLYPLVHFQLGRAALMMNDAREAIQETELEKQANPNMADAYLLAAEAHTLLMQFTNCAMEYQKAIKLRPQQANIYIKLAQCYRKKGDLEAASAMLGVASTKESGMADIYKEQGAIFEMKGDVNRAIEAYQQYFVLNPDAQDRPQIEARISALQRGLRP